MNTRRGSIDAFRPLRDLNPAQRSAVEAGIDGDTKPPPALLIAAGAGTGKTKTLAHRVAHLILNGANPQRLLLLTFTRRAALEMTRRAHQILAETKGDGADRAALPTAILPWSGTFHSVGSRLLRLHAPSIGLDPSFTVLDRSDSADLFDLVRSELGLARMTSRFPRKGTCVAIYSYTVNTGCMLEETLAQGFTGARFG
jgi:DNA helicase II / ATP-dependent DNA helicase PcrA